MFTICPKCALTLAVTAADLRVGQGYVRCGRCASVFNALAGLHEESRPADAPPSADRRTATPSPPPPPLMMEVPAAPAAEAEPDTSAELADLDIDLRQEVTAGVDPAPDTMEFALGSADLAQIFVAPEVVEGDAATGTFESIVLEGGLPNDEEEPPESLTQELAAADAELEMIARAARETVADPGSATMQFEALQPTPTAAPLPPPPRDAFQPRAEDVDAYEEADARARITRWYGLAAAALGVLLLVQIVHRNRNELALSPLLNGPLTNFYAALGRPLAPRWDPAALDVRQLGAIAESGVTGELLVRASIRNEAARAQPMPYLRLTLQDRYGKRIASRDLEPTEYLGARAGGRAFLAAGQRVDAEVSVVDPGSNAVGFEVDACLPNGRGGVACAGDASPAR